MLFASWFKRLKANTSRGPRRGKRQGRVRLHLEALETRITPTTYTVNSLDGGNNVVGSLRYYVDNVVANGDTINFGISGTINLQGAVSLGHNVTIDGTGHSRRLGNRPR